MKKLRALFLALLLCAAGGAEKVFAQGYPVIDVANLVQSIESVFQYYQQIQNTIEQVQNTYKQIEQAAQQMATFNFDDLKNLGDNYSSIDWAQNPFEVITATRNSAQDITQAVNKQMNKINALEDSLTNETISFGGMKVSIADLCGVGDSKKNIIGFTQNAWEYTTNMDDGPFADMIKGWEGKLDYEQRKEIMRKYGMSPRNYALLEAGNVQLNKLVVESNIYSTEQGQKMLLAEIEGDQAALDALINNAPEGSPVAQQQATNKGIQQIEKDLGGLHGTLNRLVGLFSNKIMADKREQAIKQMQEVEEENNRNADTSSSALSETGGL